MSAAAHDAFAIELRFDGPPSPTATAATATAGRAVLRVRGVVVWDFEWTWVELLEHLAASWRYLQWEEAAPIPVDDIYALPDARRSAASYFATGRNAEREEELFEAFCEAHDLARGLRGVWPAPVWIVRAGKLCSVWTPKEHAWLAADDVLAELARAGDAIAARLELTDDARAADALRSWAAREQTDSAELVSIATGLSRELVVEAAGTQSFDEFWDLSAVGTNEVLAAARMVGGPAPASVVRAIITAIRALPRAETPELDELARVVERVDGPPYEQGIQAARWLRDRLGISLEPVNPRALLNTWGVYLETFETVGGLDAICAWGRKHGPAILLNPKGRRARGKAGQRSTLAHEIAHLLLDRDGALPVAEVLGGRVPPAVEQRAGAFAAELLIPQQVVRDALTAGGAIRRIVSRLRTRYGVSGEVIAWQARNGSAPLTVEDQWYLRSLVSDPTRY